MVADADTFSSNHPCSNGIAVANPQENVLLVQDCTILLNSRDTLSGGAQLNWNAEIPITQWDGISVGSTPMRVQGVQLEVRGLSGRIPSEFGNLSGLRVLSFRANRLEGTIPPELGALSELARNWTYTAIY